MCGNETGFRTLRSTGRVPDIVAGHAATWPDLLTLIQQITGQTIVLDALGGAERICMDWICETEFKGEWTGFVSYGKGMARVLVEFTKLWSTLERTQKNVIVCAHPRVRTFNNPDGESYDMYEADCDQKNTWPTISRWADALLFGKFYRTTKDGKGVGDDKRVLYATPRAAFEAGNRYGMPSEIPVPADPAQVWAAIYQYIQKGKV